MSRLIFLACLVLLEISGSGYAQQPPQDTPAPWLNAPEVLRLPPVESGPMPSPDVLSVPVPEPDNTFLEGTPDSGVLLDTLPAGPFDPVPLLEDELPKPKLWDGGFELGLDGASGNNESFNFRLGLNARRRTPLNAFTIQMDYFKKSNLGVETSNRLFSETRLERFFLGSPWTCFVHGTGEYDQFAAFDTRLASDVGIGRKLIENDTTFLIFRFGVGVERSFGSPNDRVIPEAVFGADFEHRLTTRHRLVAAIEYMPDMLQFSQYRIYSHAAWEYLIDKEINLNLKLGILDRYDSMPYGKKANDLDYAAVLLWKF